MIATNPITIDGKQYDRYSLNLAITGKYNSDGSSDANVAMRLVPTRIADGQVYTADAHAIGISLGTLASIQSALQTYLQTKGL